MDVGQTPMHLAGQRLGRSSEALIMPQCKCRRPAGATQHHWELLELDWCERRGFREASQQRNYSGSPLFPSRVRVTSFFSKGDPFLGLASVELACKPFFFFCDVQPKALGSQQVCQSGESRHRLVLKTWMLSHHLCPRACLLICAAALQPAGASAPSSELIFYLEVQRSSVKIVLALKCQR